MTITQLAECLLGSPLDTSMATTSIQTRFDELGMAISFAHVQKDLVTYRGLTRTFMLV